MQKLFTLLLLSFLSVSSLSAQWGGFGGKKGKTIKGTIKGALIDSITDQPVSYATLSLHKAGKEKIIDGILSENDGAFKFSEVVNGKYDIRISFLGYEDKILKNVEVTLKKPTTNLKNVLMGSSAVMLDEVQVTEKRSLIESKVDKIVFNAEDDSSTAGGDATDVLRKVPMLSVDLQGNVSIRGSQQIQILINGKPSGMFSTNTADALKMFPADQIKKVEVITQPGAKYDGEGSGGIINIITKGKNVEGVAGSINTSVGTRQNNGNVSLNVGRGRFGFTTNWGLFYSLPNDADFFLERVLSNTNQVVYRFDGETNSSRLGFNGSASAFYDFNAYNALNTSFTYRGFGFDQDTEGAMGSFAGNSFMRDNNGNNLFAGYDWNTDFTKKFPDNDKQELSFALQVSGNDQNQENFVNESPTPFNQQGRKEEINNLGDNVEFTGQVDYVHPIGAAKLEIGAKSVIRNIDSDSRFLVYSNGDIPVKDNLRSNIFQYDQDVYAAYASYNFYFQKLNIVTGLRYERTDIGGDGKFEGATFTNGYNNFLPNIAISKSLKNFKNLKLSYSKRIQRPSLRFINPFRNTADFGNISFGDPTLRPELTDQFELGYNTNILGASVFATGYYKITTEIIESIVQLGAMDISTTTFSNVGKNKSIGLNLFVSKSVGRFTVRLGGDVGTYNATGIVGGQELSNSALNYRVFTSGEFSLSGSFKADYFGIFSAPRYTLQGKNPSFSMIGVGMRKDFKNKMSLGIRIIEPFEEFKSFDTEIDGDGFRQTSSFAIPFRSFGISFSYKFGKVDFRERKSKIKNTDQKQGDAGQGGGGGQQQGGGQRGN